MGPCPVCLYLGARSSWWPGCVLADKRGQQRVGVPTIVIVEFGQLFQRIDTTMPNRYLVAGE